MNKKLFLGMFAAAGMLLATSCSNDELDMVQSGNEAQVSFSLGLDGGTASRAISDGKSADILVYAVFDKDGNRISTIQKVEKEGVTFPTTENINLAKGQTYKVAFWAQNSDCDAYTVSEDMKVTVDYSGGVNNDETRDAFFKTVEFTVTGSTSIDVELKRPFAQINVGVTKKDWEDAVASGITIKESSVTIKQAATNIDLLTGVVSNPVDVVYDLAEIPNDPATLKAKNREGNEEEYQWLSMSYILVNDVDPTPDVNGLLGTNEAVLDKLAFTFAPESGKNITFSEGLAGVPVRRNWRTNILGKILTGDIQFNITIDPVYDGDIIYPSKQEQELEMAATFGGTVTLTDDVLLTAPLNVAADMILNIADGKTLTGSINLAEGASLTVNGGAINNTDNTVSGIISNGDLTLNDVDITSTRHALRIESGNVVINGGTYTVEPTSKMTVHALNVGDDNKVANVTIKGGTFIGPKYDNSPADSGAAVLVRAGSTVTIEGGDFSKGKNNTLSSKEGTLTVKGGTFDQDPSAYVADGYVAINKDGKYIILQIATSERTITINSKEEFMALNYLNENWNVLFSNGQGTYVSNYYTQNGGKGGDYYYDWTWTIKLNVDIDLEGEESTEPIINISRWKLFDGQNHTIKNAKITTATNETTDAGLFYASRTAGIKNLKLDNITVKGSLVGNSNAGILCGSCAYDIDNITVTNSSVWGGKYTGAVVGYTYGDVTNCTVTNCQVEGGYKCGGIVGYICASGNTTNPGVVDNNTLTNCTVKGTVEIAGGKTEQILGRVVGNFNCNGTCLNNTINTMTTDATKNIGQIEDGKVVEGQVYYAKDAATLKDAIIAGGKVVLESNITVDEWIMYSETLSIAEGTIITIKMDGLTIDGQGHTLTVNSIKSAGNGNNLFHSATNLNISNLTIKYADGLAGGIGLKSGVISNVTFNGGTYSILPGTGAVEVKNCTFASKGTSIYFEEARDNLTVTGCTFNNAADANIILLRGAVQFTNNTVNSGRTVNVVSGSPVVTGNNFTDVRLKVYKAATATISNNIINNLEFEADTYASTFENNNMSDTAQNLLNSKTKSN